MEIYRLDSNVQAEKVEFVRITGIYPLQPFIFEGFDIDQT
jgi:hypothetical protein